jgi:hypothetical protein
MMQIKDYRRDVNDAGSAAPLLKIPGSAIGHVTTPKYTPDYNFFHVETKKRTTISCQPRIQC